MTLSIFPVGGSGSGTSSVKKAATFVVSQTPDVGDFTTIQAAVNALPAEGGFILVREGTYSIASAVSLPDKGILIRGCGDATVIQPVGAISCFKIVDGLTAYRNYVVENLSIVGDGVSNQVAFQLDDANNNGNYTLDHVNISGMKTFVDWSQYDLAYLQQSNVWIYNSVLTPIVGNSVIATTPQPANSYFASVAIRSCQTVFSFMVSGGSTYAWDADADCDLWIEQGQYCSFVAGLAMNGGMLSASGFIIYGSGDLTFNGNGWDASDFFGDSFIQFSTVTSPHSGVDGRLIKTGSVSSSTLICALKHLGVAWVSDCTVIDPLTTGSAYFGIEVLNQKSVVRGCTLRGLGGAVSVWPQGGIKLDGAHIPPAIRCKVTDNFFEGVLTGNTVLETVGADFNIIHDNTGYYTGLGPLIVGPNTVEHNNIN
jgi:hypothetical protein